MHELMSPVHTLHYCILSVSFLSFQYVPSVEMTPSSHLMNYFVHGSLNYTISKFSSVHILWKNILRQKQLLPLHLFLLMSQKCPHNMVYAEFILVWITSQMIIWFSYLKRFKLFHLLTSYLMNITFPLLYTKIVHIARLF